MAAAASSPRPIPMRPIIRTSPHQFSAPAKPTGRPRSSPSRASEGSRAMRFRSLGLILLTLCLFAMTATRGLADWRDDIKVLRVGYLAGDNVAYRAAQLEPFRAYLEGKIGLPVELVPAPTYGALIEAQAGSRVQYAIYSAASFATASASCRCVEPVAVPTSLDGSEGFYAILLA